jgi:hypothetical protein
LLCSALVIVGLTRDFFRLMSSIVSFVSWATFVRAGPEGAFPGLKTKQPIEVTAI